MINKPVKINDYIENLERADFRENKIVNTMIQDFEICKADRGQSGFNDRCDIGIRIMKNDLEYGVYGNRTSRRQFVNFVDKNLKHKTAELKGADIEISLSDHDGRISLAQELLESEVVYAFDYMDILTHSWQVITDMYFQNWGIARIEWDSYNDTGSENWITGFPVFNVRDPRNIYVNTGIQREDLADINQIFDVEIFRTERIKKLYPEFADMIIEGITAIPAENYLRQTSEKKMSIVVHQYLKSYIIEERVLVDNDSGDVSFWLEKDYQDYLGEMYAGLEAENRLEIVLRYAESMLPELENEEELTALFMELTSAKDRKKVELQILDLIAQEEYANDMLPDRVAVTKKLKKEHRDWFEVRFIPEISLLLDEPRRMGLCSYMFLCADRDPDYSYPISMAYKMSPELEMHSAILTMQMMYAIKLNKPQLVIIPGAIANEREFLQNYQDPDFVVREMSKDWRSKGGFAADQKPFYYVYPQEMGRLAEIIEQKMERWIDEGTRNPKASQGVSEYAGESGKAVIARQVAAKQGDKTDVKKLEYFYKQVCEKMKEQIAEKKEGIKHRVEHRDEQNELDMVDVNTNENNQLVDVYKHCFVQVKLEDNVDELMARKKNEALLLLEKGLSTKIRALRDFNPPDLDKRIQEIKEQDETLQLMEMLSNIPEEQRVGILQQLSQMAQGSKEKETGRAEKSPVNKQTEVVS